MVRILENTKKKITTIIYWLLFIFVIVVAIIPTLSVLKVPLPFKLYSVESGSMVPTINVGDLIFVRSQKQYNVSDIITFYPGSSKSQTTVTHRIVKVNEDGTFTTKGDFNSVADLDTVKQEDIVGKYFFRLPFLGYPITFVHKPLGFIFLIVIPAVVIGYEEIEKIKKEISKKRSKHEILRTDY